MKGDCRHRSKTQTGFWRGDGLSLLSVWCHTGIKNCDALKNGLIVLNVPLLCGMYDNFMQGHHNFMMGQSSTFQQRMSSGYIQCSSATWHPVAPIASCMLVILVLKYSRAITGRRFWDTVFYYMPMFWVLSSRACICINASNKAASFNNLVTDLFNPG